MIHYQKKLSVLTVCTLLILSLLTANCSGEKKNVRPRPNFILIVTDDQDADSVKVMAKTRARVIKKGITFTNAYVTSPVSAPSRGSILTGRYPKNTGITSGYEQLHGEQEEYTIAPLLHNAGYRTALVGKYLNRYGQTHPDFIPKGWDEWHALIDENIYYNYQLNENGRIVRYGDRREDYITDVLSAKAAHFLDTGGNDQPFFLCINTVAPHAKPVPAPEYAHEFKDVTFSFAFEEDISDKPAWVRDYRKMNDNLIREYFGHAGRMENLYRNRWRTLLSVDDMVDNIMNHLEKNGLLQNTYIFLVSDNGDGLTKHIPVSAKLSPYDEGIRVPFIALGPGIPENRQVDQLTSTADILPTLADLAGIKPAAEVDGRSLVPIFNNPALAENWREFIFTELTQAGKSWPWKSTPPSYQLIRSKEFKYIEYASGEREYYDLRNDPDEMENLYSSLSPEQQRNLSTQVKKMAAGEL